ncbi:MULTISPECIES: ABC transporter substrate-binding protein [Chelativorans]|jgi:branched-chain amino acid transport system substrate-binding protein|uniref:Amino acid/amide ABC transporter substrate-binding protein, HAAT family n=1 Tax=Chelativorans sp. (strain BNC1) TaxID=266779 RepID=Q11L42_CHESB|nr:MULTISPECIES: ABC transporter substrate-binding protein [Chelativorans]
MKSAMRNSILAAALLAGVSSAALAEPGVTDDKIRIGTFGPLTGPVSIYGYPIINGAVAVYNEINAKGGIHGRKIEMVYEDDACDAAKTRAAVKKLVHSSDVFAIHGGTCSSAVNAARDEIIASEVPYMVMAMVLDSITSPVAKNMFTTTQTGTLDGVTMVNFVKSIPDVKKVVIVKNTDDWADSHLSTIYPGLKEAGIEVAADIVLERNASDATTQALHSLEANADAVILVTYPNETAVFLREAKKYGLKGPFVGASSQMDMLAVADRAGGIDAISELYVSSYLLEPVDGEKMKEFSELYAKHFPNDKLQTLSFYGMSGAYAFVDALERAGPDLTREGFINALESTSDGFAGPAYCKISFSPENHQGCTEGHIWAVRDGKVVAIGETWPQ